MFVRYPKELGIMYVILMINPYPWRYNQMTHSLLSLFVILPLWKNCEIFERFLENKIKLIPTYIAINLIVNMLN